MYVFVESFKKEDYSHLNMPLVTVYYNTADFPDKYVARLFDFARPTDHVIVKDTLEEIRETFYSENWSTISWNPISGDELDEQTDVIEIWI